MLTKILVSIIFGGLMGILCHTKKNNGEIKKPCNNEHTIDLGFLTDMVWGIIGALVLIFISEPNDLGRVVILAIAGGYAGEGMLAHIQIYAEHNKHKIYLENEQWWEKDASSENKMEEE